MERQQPMMTRTMEGEIGRLKNSEGCRRRWNSSQAEPGITESGGGNGSIFHKKQRSLNFPLV